MYSKGKIADSWQIGWKPKAYISFVLYINILNCTYNVDNTDVAWYDLLEVNCFDRSGINTFVTIDM